MDIFLTKILLVIFILLTFKFITSLLGKIFIIALICLAGYYLLNSNLV